MRPALYCPRKLVAHRARKLRVPLGLPGPKDGLTMGDGRSPTRQAACPNRLNKYRQPKTGQDVDARANARMCYRLHRCG